MQEKSVQPEAAATESPQSLKERREAERQRERQRRYAEVSQAARERATWLHQSGQFYCSEAVFSVVNEHLGKPAPEEMVKTASGFAIGIGKSGCICGALAGGVMALGLEHGREKAGRKMPEPMFELGTALHDRFQSRRKYVCCRKLIKQFEFGSPEHKKQCVAITGEVAADVIDLLEYGVEGAEGLGVKPAAKPGFIERWKQRLGCGRCQK